MYRYNMYLSPCKIDNNKFHNVFDALYTYCTIQTFRFVLKQLVKTYVTIVITTYA